eukprot:TRINITY_DN3700_c0_g1_i11.p2 TRINITY_DN3700_c0_g1~~TRINITY_DN3700_c0_g1_i11.p2  ORF type:complete len:126 (-),score=34.30 TRINITY_DN3700_c0_g1_i11:3-380(-)
MTDNIISYGDDADEKSKDNFISYRELKGILEFVARDETFERNVEEIMTEMSNDFVQSVLDQAVDLAKMRQSQTLEPGDISFVLQKMWKLNTPIREVDDVSKNARPMQGQTQARASSSSQIKAENK